MSSIKARIERWRVAQGLGKKLSTQKYHAEIGIVILNKFVDPERDADGITEAEIMEFAQRVAHYSPSRYNGIIGAIRHITGKPNSLKFRKLRFKHFRPPNQQEFADLLRECDMAPRSHCGLIVRLLVLTGMRIAEARGLRWCDVGQNEIYLPGTITKNGQPRTIPMLAGTGEVLSRLKAVSDDEFVLPSASIKRSLSKACLRAGIPRLTHHDLRHLYATKCVEAGISLFVISKWLGHGDGGYLAGKLYCHLTDDHSRRMAEKVRIAL